MPRNGNGTYNLPQPAFTPGSVISSSAMNSDLSDVAAALTGSVSADGQTAITGQLKFTNGTAAAPSVSFSSELSTGMYWIGAGHLGFSTSGSLLVAFNQANYSAGHAGDVIEINSPTGIIYPNPVGMVTDFAGVAAPAGWLLCFGQTLTVASYPELFVALGSTNTYGGDGVTTFGIPDCRGRATYGKDNMGGSAANRITATLNFDGTVLGGVGGSQQHTLVASENGTHTHAAGTLSGNVTDPGHAHTVSALSAANPNAQASAGAQWQDVNQTLTTSTATTGITVPTLSGATATNAGAGNPHTILNPAIIFNKIIFAGRV